MWPPSPEDIIQPEAVTEVVGAVLLSSAFGLEGSCVFSAVLRVVQQAPAGPRGRCSMLTRRFDGRLECEARSVSDMGPEASVDVPVVILAGGLGTRLREETVARPKPMIEVGGNPILWHIMKIYDHFGFRRFIVPVGYLGEVIKAYFLSYADRHADFTVNTLSGDLVRHNDPPESWDVTVVDTGLDTMTGGRLRRLDNHLPGRFMVTYGDGVANVPIDRLVAFHQAHGRLATVTAVRPPARFGGLALDGDRVAEFSEKSQAEAGWINGGFFVFERPVLDYLAGDDTILEREPLERLARDGQLMAYQHEGFWEPMDTQRDLSDLNRRWSEGAAPWRVWDD